MLMLRPCCAVVHATLCRQAAEVLVREIVPRVRALLPEPARQSFRLHVVGSNMVPDSLLQLFAQHEDAVTFHGYLTDDQVGWAGPEGGSRRWGSCRALACQHARPAVACGVLMCAASYL